jgi:hypothetical protein
MKCSVRLIFMYLVCFVPGVQVLVVARTRVLS